MKLSDLSSKRMESLGISFPVMVAPMVGLSHAAFRQLIRHYTPKGLHPLLFTEMLSTRRLPYEKIERVDELRTADGETHFIPQLLGNEEHFIEKSIEKLMPLKPWGFDINMGCPAKQTLRHNWGVRLLGDRDYAARVVAMTKRHSPVPVSVKMRCGTETADPEFLDAFTQSIEDAGADWMTVHARLQSQKHKGEANWDMVSSMSERRRIPVVINGDVQTAADVIHLLDEKKADGVMIGRAATARPWILWQVAEELGYAETPEAFPGKRAPRGPEEEGRAFLESMLVYIDLLKHFFDNEERQLRRLRFHVINAQKWFLFGHSYYSKCMKGKTLEAIAEATQNLLDTAEFPMSSRINLL
jgi:tRNA-dihydrouridine synthase B